MKNITLGCLVLALSVGLHAQQTIVLPTTATSTTMTAGAIGSGLAATDKQKEGILVPIQNTTTAAVQILGVQTTGDLFIEDAPKSIPANGSVNLTVLLFAAAM